MGRTPIKGHHRGGKWVGSYSQNRQTAAGGGAALLAAGVAAGLWWNSGQPTLSQLRDGRAATTSASVARIVDGDTFIARDSTGKNLGRVRILGMDAPELARDGKPAMCGASAAKAELARLLEDRDVDLVTDPQQPDTDRYGRLLRYVEVGSTDVSESLIRSGHAPNTSRAQSHTRHDTYAAAEDEAQEQQRGLWGACP